MNKGCDSVRQKGKQGDKKNTRKIREVRLTDSEGVATVGSSTSKRGNKRRGKQGAELTLSSWHVICRVGLDRRSHDWELEEKWG